MAVYRCPKCGQILSRVDATACLTCGLRFDEKHAPVLDDGSGKPENVRKKENRARIIVIAVIVIVFVGALLWAFLQKNFIMSHWRR